jgi:hypothetical protein
MTLDNGFEDPLAAANVLALFAATGETLLAKHRKITATTRFIGKIRREGSL